MHTLATISKYKVTDDGTDLIIHIPKLQLGEMIVQKHITQIEARFDDGRHISNEQRKKAYATLNDISKWVGDVPEVVKEQMKYRYIELTGGEYISLQDCTMDEARDFINVIMDFALENGVELSEEGYKRTDDIGRYLYFCLKHKKCAICGQHGEIHHEDTIGMGFDRDKVDDSDKRKICLCRKHHTIAHQLGVDRFHEMYKVYGIVVKEEENEIHNTDSTCYEEELATDNSESKDTQTDDNSLTTVSKV